MPSAGAEEGFAEPYSSSSDSRFGRVTSGPLTPGFDAGNDVFHGVTSW